MLAPKVEKQPRPKKVPALKTSPASKSAAPEVCVSHDKIRERAFQMYESRGSKPGHDMQDWLHAEHQILER